LMDNVLDIYNSFLVDNNDKKMVNLDPKINWPNFTYFSSSH
jgi:hypothetical protein